MDQKCNSSKNNSSTIFVSIETPYNAWCPWILRRNIQYAIMASAHATQKGEAVYTPHLVNTQTTRLGFNSYVGDSFAALTGAVFGSPTNKYGSTREKVLDITNEVREHKIDKIVCYTDFGISPGMKLAIDLAEAKGKCIEYRTLPTDWKEEIYGQSFKSTFFPTVSEASITGLCLYGLKKLLFRR